MRSRAALAAVLGVALSGCALRGRSPLPPGEALSEVERRQAIARAAVWSPTETASLDLRAGPRSKHGFAPGQLVTCDYKRKDLSGASPKFACEIAPGDEVKVKYGAENGEVVGEVLASRLFWALGFPADRMYPVRVRCRGCPRDPWKEKDAAPGSGEVEFSPTVIERKLPGHALESWKDSGWKWSELEIIGPEAGPDARAQREALELLAAFVQHTDSKRPQQRLFCPEGEEQGKTGCRHPVLMVNDLGLTFGRADLLNRNRKSGANLERWSRTPVWKDRERCVAELGRSLTGTLHDPRISEPGRAFLAGLLGQLSDAQLTDLFEVAGVERRTRDGRVEGAPASVEEWVAVFKRKRSEIVQQRCP